MGSSLGLYLALVLGIFSVSHCVSFPGVKTTEKYNQSTSLDKDGNFILFWNFNDSHITFEVHVRTKGWVGFGLSGNGNMYPGDVVVGWVTDDGQNHFADRHTVGHQMPIEDKSQDWELLHAEENDFGTLLKFVRLIETCDSNEDLAIPEGTVRLIYAYNHRDPTSDSSITYHGTSRGTKSVSLLSSAKPHSMPSDIRHFDFLNQNYLLPDADTTYRCRGFELPNIGKHHMISYVPIITPGNELHVHHMVLYRCKGINATADGINGMCYVNRPKELPECYEAFIAWAIGGQGFTFPDTVGFSVSGPDDPSFYILETHYDNPNMKSGIIDNSGVRMTLTRTLRPIEAGMWQLGHVTNRMLIIPPYQNNFVAKGYCSEQCVTESLLQSNLSDIKVMAAFQHSHLLGTAIKTRHLRNGVELKPLIQDPNYDFDFQEFRALPKEVTVQSGDSFIVECTYDSTKRTTVTKGGLSTRDEMCLTFVYYYPKMGLVNCFSLPVPSGPMTELQAAKSANWKNDTLTADFLASIPLMDTYHYCGGDKYQSPALTRYLEKETKYPYVPPAPKC